MPGCLDVVHDQLAVDCVHASRRSSGDGRSDRPCWFSGANECSVPASSGCCASSRRLPRSVGAVVSEDHRAPFERVKLRRVRQSRRVLPRSPLPACEAGGGGWLMYSRSPPGPARPAPMSGRMRTSFFSGEQGGHRQRRRADDDDQDDESGQQQLVCGAPGARLVRNDALESRRPSYLYLPR